VAAAVRQAVPAVATSSEAPGEARWTIPKRDCLPTRALPLGPHPEVAEGQLICAASRRSPRSPSTSQPRPELADLCSAPLSVPGTERRADSAFRTAGPACRTEWSSRSVTPAASGLPRWDTMGQADRPGGLAPHRASPVSGAPGSPGQRAAPGTPPIKVCGNSFPLVRGVHSNPLRSRVRRFESCWGRSSET
jgi:hypothetical protein